MNILICPDSFKGSLSSKAICEVLQKEFNSLNPAINVMSLPMADGGEGTLDVLQSHGNYIRVEMQSVDPLNRPISTSYLWDSVKEVIVIEMAQASGIERLTDEEQNCMYTSTYCTGLQIVHTINTYNPKKIYLAVGSSATNDAGLGMLSAMGCTIIDSDGNQIIIPTGESLLKVSKIVRSEAYKILIKDIEFMVVNDVDNPFSGTKGAAYTYAEQKGASLEQIELLDQGLQVIRDIVLKDKNINLDEIVGAGAAGGIAGGAIAFLEAKMVTGTSFISKVANLESEVAQADLVITGEGRLDSQTLQGKLVNHVCKLCNHLDNEMVIICGVNDATDNELVQLGSPKVFALNEYNHEAYTDETTRRDLKKVARDIFTGL